MVRRLPKWRRPDALQLQQPHSRHRWRSPGNRIRGIRHPVHGVSSHIPGRQERGEQFSTPPSCPIVTDDLSQLWVSGVFWPCKPGVSPAAAVNHISHGYSEPLRGCDDSRFVHFVYFPSQGALADSGVTNWLASRSSNCKSSARPMKRKR